MSREQAKKRVREAKHQRKTTTADVVLVHPDHGQILEIHNAPGTKISIKAPVQ